MIRTIPLKIQNEYITGDKGMIGASGSHNDVILRMEFSGMWDGLTKMVQFRDALGEATIEVLLTADMLEADDTSVYLVPVPNGAKKYAGEMTLCIKGAAVSAQKETRATLAVYGRFTVEESKWSADAETEADVPASNVEQLQGQIDNVLATIVDARKAATEAAKSAEGAALSQSRAQTSEQYAGEYARDAANSATSALNSAASASDNATAAANSATAAEANADAAAGSAANAAASATSAGESASAASEKASDAANSASAAATSAQTAQSAASAAADAAGTASTAAEAASGSASQAQESAAAAAESAASVSGINKTAQSWAVGGTGTREGEDTNNAKYWAEQAKEAAGGDFATKADLAAKPSMVIAEIPKGRMRGDVDGDGKLTQNDLQLITDASGDSSSLTSIQKWCADVNSDGSVDVMDMLEMNKYISGSTNLLTSTPTFADYYNNWTYHKVNDTSGYWTTELSIPDITEETEGSIIWGGTGFTGTFIKAEAFPGGVRIYANYPPIEALPCAVSYHTGAGGQFIISNTGVLETGAKYAVVYLTASGWSEEKKQIISVPGLKGDVSKRLIIPTQPSTDIEKYYSAGIRISARGDNTLTFSCDTIPTEMITVVLVIIPIVGKFEG